MSTPDNYHVLSKMLNLMGIFFVVNQQLALVLMKVDYDAACI